MNLHDALNYLGFAQFKDEYILNPSDSTKFHFAKWNKEKSIEPVKILNKYYRSFENFEKNFTESEIDTVRFPVLFLYNRVYKNIIRKEIEDKNFNKLPETEKFKYFVAEDSVRYDGSSPNLEKLELHFFKDKTLNFPANMVDNFIDKLFPRVVQKELENIKEKTIRKKMEILNKYLKNMNKLI